MIHKLWMSSKNNDAKADLVVELLRAFVLRPEDFQGWCTVTAHTYHPAPYNQVLQIEFTDLFPKNPVVLVCSNGCITLEKGLQHPSVDYRGELQVDIEAKDARQYLLAVRGELEAPTFEGQTVWNDNITKDGYMEQFQ